MTFSRLIVSAASIAAAVASAPAFAQQHEVGHWLPAPGSSSAAGVGASVQPSFAGGVFVASGDVTGDARPFNGFVSRFPAGSRADAVPTTPLDDPRLQTRNATTSVMPPHRGWGPWEVQPGRALNAPYEPYLQLELENTHSQPVRPAAPMLKAQPSQEQKYMEIKLKEVLISGVIANGNPAAPATDGHKNGIGPQSWHYAQPERPLVASGSRDAGPAAIAPKPKLETVSPRMAR